MGSRFSKEEINKSQLDRLKEIVENDDAAGVKKFIEKNVEKWKTEEVKFAVTGRTKAGKSSFINAVRGLSPGDQDFAITGFGNTTQKPSFYKHPGNSKITYVDLPGAATLDFPKSNYVKAMKIEEYDFFFIFFTASISEDDYWLVKQLHELSKPFCLVRSKIDEDINSAVYDGYAKGDVIPAIRKGIEDQHDTDEMLKKSKAIFLISSRYPELGDWPLLIDYIEDNVDSVKFEALIYSLPTFSSYVIEKKYKALKKKVWMVTVETSLVAAVPIPGLDITLNLASLVASVLYFMYVFNLNNLDGLDNFKEDELKCKPLYCPGVDIAAYVLAKLGKWAAIMAAQSVTDELVPIIGSIVSGGTNAVVVYRFLSNLLEDLVEDARTVYKYVEKHDYMKGIKKALSDEK